MVFIWHYQLKKKLISHILPIAELALLDSIFGVGNSKVIEQHFLTEETLMTNRWCETSVSNFWMLQKNVPENFHILIYKFQHVRTWISMLLLFVNNSLNHNCINTHSDRLVIGWLIWHIHLLGNKMAAGLSFNNVPNNQMYTGTVIFFFAIGN